MMRTSGGIWRLGCLLVCWANVIFAQSGVFQHLENQPPPPDESFTQAWEPNFSTPFTNSIPTAEELDELKSLTDPSVYNHPEFGILPPDAPCKACIELIDRRTENSRYFVKKGTRGKYFYRQQGYGTLHYLDAQGFWRTLNPRLKQTAPHRYESVSMPNPITYNHQANYTTVGLTYHAGAIRMNEHTEFYIKENKATTLLLNEALPYTTPTHSVGADGIYTRHLLSGIDRKQTIKGFGLKTDWILSRPLPLLPEQYLVIREKVTYPQGLRLITADQPTENQWLNTDLKWVNSSGQEIARLHRLSLLDKNNAFTQAHCGYQLLPPQANPDGTISQIIEIYIAGNWLNASGRQYPVTIDPLFTASATWTDGDMGSGYHPSCYLGACYYKMNVPVPPAVEVTNILNSFTYESKGSCNGPDGGWDVSVGSCTSLTYRCTLSGQIKCMTTNPVPLFNSAGQPQSCVRPPQCEPYLVDAVLAMRRCNNGAGPGCSTDCIVGINNSWTVTIEGYTLQDALITLVVAPGEDPTNFTVCPRDTITLSANARYGVPPYRYRWMPGNLTTATVRVSPPLDVTYTLTVFDMCDQQAVAQQLVRLKKAPAQPSVSYLGPVCEGENLKLLASANVPGTSAPIERWEWKGPDGFVSTEQNPTILSVSTAASGEYVCTAWFDGCASVPSKLNVVVTPNPTRPVVTGNTRLCEGNKLQLIAQGRNGSRFFWRGPNGFAATGDTILISNMTQANAGTYDVIAIIGSCSSAVSSVNVVVTKESVPAPVASNDSPVCPFGPAVTLTATEVPGATDYVWQGPDNFSANGRIVTRNNLLLTHAGTYEVMAVINGCSSAVAKTEVTLKQAPISPTGVTTNTPICAGQTLKLTMNTSTIPGISYKWEGPLGFVSTNPEVEIVNATTDMQGIYTASYVADCNSEPVAVNAIINPTPAKPTLPVFTPGCTGSPVSITAGTDIPAIFEWRGPNGFSFTGETLRFEAFKIENNGTYQVYAYASGCTSAVTDIVLTAFPIPPVPGNIETNSPVCETKPLKLKGADVSIPGAIYIWKGPNGFEAIGREVEKPITTLGDSGVYEVIVVAAGCTSAIAYTQPVVILPSRPVSVWSEQSCLGLRVTFYNATVGQDLQASVTPDIRKPETVFAFTDSVSYTYPDTGRYTYRFSVSSSSACFGALETTTVVQQRPIIADFSTEPLPGVPLFVGDSKIRILNLSKEASRYEWQFGDGGYSSQFEPVYQYTKPGNYYIRLSAYSADNQCADTISKGPYPVLEENLFMATGFTPNQDGNNDSLLVVGTNIEKVSLAIYSRWGELVWKDSGTRLSWDGSDSRGNKCPEGIYTYQLSFSFRSNPERVAKRSGTISLIR